MRECLGALVVVKRELSGVGPCRVEIITVHPLCAHAVRSEILMRKNIYLALHEKIRHKPDLLILQGAGPAPGLFIQIISEIM